MGEESKLQPGSGRLMFRNGGCCVTVRDVKGRRYRLLESSMDLVDDVRELVDLVNGLGVEEMEEFCWGRGVDEWLKVLGGKRGMVCTGGGAE